MEYFEEMALGPQCSIPTPRWKGHIDDIIGIVLKEQGDAPFNHLNSVDSQITFTMEALTMMVVSHSWIPNKCFPHTDYTIHTTAYRKLTHTDYYLDYNS